MNNNARLLKTIKFYQRSLIVIWVTIALVIVSWISALVNWAVGGNIVLLVGFASVPVSVFGVALMIVALTIIAKTAKRFFEFKKSALLGGISAAAYPILAIAYIASINFLSIFGPQAQMVVAIALNPVNVGVALLIIHQVVIEKARKLLVADAQPAVVTDGDDAQTSSSV